MWIRSSISWPLVTVSLHTKTLKPLLNVWQMSLLMLQEIIPVVAWLVSKEIRNKWRKGVMLRALVQSQTWKLRVPEWKICRNFQTWQRENLYRVNRKSSKLVPISIRNCLYMRWKPRLLMPARMPAQQLCTRVNCWSIFLNTQNFLRRWSSADVKLLSLISKPYPTSRPPPCRLTNPRLLCMRLTPYRPRDF